MTRINEGSTCLIGVFGAGGFGRELMPLARRAAERFETDNQAERCEVVFVDIAPFDALLNGHCVLSEDAFWRANVAQKRFNVAVGDSNLRMKIALAAEAAGGHPIDFVAQSAVLHDELVIGPGVVLCPHTTVNSNATIGRYFQANINSYVAHDAVIGDFVTFAPNVCCNGNVHIRDRAYIGTGAILRPGTREKPLVIGEGAVVGMGAVVTKDVAPFTTVVGIPAGPLPPPNPKN